MREIAIEDLRLARSVRGDPGAADRMLRRVHPRVLSVVLGAVGGGVEAEELVQVCLVEVLRCMDGYRGEGSIESWAGQLAFRTVMRQLKRRRWHERVTVSAVEDVAEKAPGPEAHVLREQAWRRLELSLQRVPPERRATLMLRLVHEHSVPEIAELTSVSVNTVKDRLRTGLRELRAIFARDRALQEMMREAMDGR